MRSYINKHAGTTVFSKLLTEYGCNICDLRFCVLCHLSYYRQKFSINYGFLSKFQRGIYLMQCLAQFWVMMNNASSIT